MFSHAMKEMTFFKVRYVLIVLILFFVSSLIFIINGLANGLSWDNASSIKNIKGESFLLDQSADNRIDKSKFEMSNLQKSDMSEDIQPMSLRMSTIEKKDHDKAVDVTIIAVNPTTFLEPEVQEGERLQKNKLNTVLLDDSLRNEGIEIGHQVKDEKSGIWLEVVGFTNKQTFSHTPAAFVTFDTWESMTNKQGESFFSALVSINQMEHQASEKGIWVDKEQVIRGIPGYEEEQNSLMMMLSFLIVIAVFIIAAFFYIMTIQKTNQFGILKAMGARTSFLVQTTLLQGLLLTFISVVLALGFTWGTLVLLPNNIPFLFDLEQIAKFSGIIIVVSIIGSLISTLNIMKADPIQAMGRVE